MFDIYSGLEKQKSRFPENRYTKNVAVISKFDTRAASTRTITTVGIVPGGGPRAFSPLFCGNFYVRICTTQY